MTLRFPAPQLRAAIEARVEPDPNSGCWLWASTLNNTGYGALNFGGKRLSAHRTSFEAWVGTIPPDFVIDHKCRTPACVNPAHLRAVTVRTNVLENSASLTAVNAAKTHCKHGHEFTPENTYRVPKGRVCRQCLRDRERRYDAAKREAHMFAGGIPRCTGLRAA